MKPIEKLCVLLKAPWPISKLIRIRLLLKAAPPRKNERTDIAGQHGSSDHDLESSDPELGNSMERKCQQLCKFLNEERPGKLLVAVPGQDLQHCIVFCPKVTPAALPGLHWEKRSQSSNREWDSK